MIWPQKNRSNLFLSRKAEIGLLICVILILGGYVLFPSLRLLAAGLVPENFTALFASWQSANVRALGNSVWISIASVAGSGVVGTTLAYVFFRFSFPMKQALSVMAALPIALPPLVGVLAFLFLYGESGILPRGLQSIFGLENVPFSFSGLWAVWLVHVYSMYVFFYFFCGAALKTLDRSLLDASYDLGASHTRTFRKIIFPHLRPSMISASLLVFMISMASFTAPMLFAGSKNFLTLQIYNYKTNGDLGYSATISLVLTVICLIFLVMIEWKESRSRAPTASKGSTPPPVPLKSGMGRLVAAVASFVLVVVLLLPILTIILISFVEEGSWTYQILPQRYTFENYTSLILQPDVAEPIINSLIMASIATLGNILFGVAAAVLIVKGRLPGRGILKAIAILPFAIPGTVIAVNLIVTFSEASALSFGHVLVGSFWMLPLAYFIRHIPLIFRSTLAALESFDDRLLEASADLGASRLFSFKKVVLPTIGPGIAAGSLLTFVIALGEFVSSIMLYVYDNRPISVEILSQLRIYNFGAAAAYSVFLMILITFVTIAVFFLRSDKRSIGSHGNALADVG
ncbi:MAG: iron ABC transporter permease [Bacteroidetes bacterium]|nr:MAG: iron ABC transporter permease [Bacteroidota bacterium]